jgi:large subunit ribosomal protein L25
MSTHGALTAQVRNSHGKGAARSLRRSGQIPGIIYGAGGESVSLALSPNEFVKATDPERAWNTLFSLTIKEDGKADIVQPCMVADAQRDSIKRNFVHVDFLRIDPDKEVIRKIPVEYVGKSVGVVKGGKLKKFRRFVKVACKPADLPVKLTVDITPIDGGESLRMKDVSLGNVRLVENPEHRLVFVEIPKARKEEEGEGEKK